MQICRNTSSTCIHVCMSLCLCEYLHTHMHSHTHVQLRKKYAHVSKLVKHINFWFWCLPFPVCSNITCSYKTNIYDTQYVECGYWYRIDCCCFYYSIRNSLQQIELPAKLLDTFLWSNKSHINQELCWTLYLLLHIKSASEPISYQAWDSWT